MGFTRRKIELNSVIKNVRYLINCVLKVIYDGDDFCAICKKTYYIQEGKLICNNCENKLVSDNIYFEIEKDNEKIPCYCFNYYKSIIREMLFNLKYNRDFLCGEVLANCLSEVINFNNIKFDYITFIPSTKKALKTRGYNQSQVLAKYIGSIVNKKVIKTLIKVKSTKDQIGLNGESRWSNVEGAFKFKNRDVIRGKTILLVDDVITTGATIYNCYRELMVAGAKSIIVISVAKSKIF